MKSNMDSTKQALLAKYGLTVTNYLAHGMEAEVYRRDTETVLKLYSRAQLDNLHILQAFYANLDRTRIPYALPSIRHLDAEGQYAISIESYLPGHPLSKHIAAMRQGDLDSVFPGYVAAVLRLSQVGMPPHATRYRLFDRYGISQQTDGGWHAYARRWLQHKVQTLNPYFERDIADFSAKIDALDGLLSQPYCGPYRLVHGDIFPGNLLVDAQGDVLALLDFGLFTHYGDPLLDAAIAWVCFDMYDELQADVRTRLLPFFLDQLGPDIQGQLLRYLLLYSLVSANAYAADCSDGHYAWCIANLNTDRYWNEMA